MVIFDGPDGTGKSTLLKDLKSRGHVISKPYYPSKNQLRYYLQTGSIYQGSWLERYYPSEVVYPRIKEGRDVLSDAKQFLIEASLMPYNPIIVYVRPPRKNIKQNIKFRGDDYIQASEIDRMIDEYDLFMKRTLIPVIKYDYTVETPEDLLYRIEDAIKWLKLRRRIPAEYLHAGNPFDTDNIMIIGDEPSPTSVGNGFILPFISDTGSSLFLHECLTEAGFYDDQMPYFTNFYKFTSHEVKAKEMNQKVLLDEIERMQPKKIICLGNSVLENLSESVSQKYITQNEIEITKVPHPSFIKRFGGREKYITDLKNVL